MVKQSAAIDFAHVGEMVKLSAAVVCGQVG